MFIARDTTNEAVDKHLPQGTIVNEEAERMDAQSLASYTIADTDGAYRFFYRYTGRSQSAQGQPIVNYAPLSGNYPNMNPALNENITIPPGNVQVMNVLDLPANNNNALEQLAMADVGYLQGMPNSMFDWGA